MPRPLAMTATVLPAALLTAALAAPALAQVTPAALVAVQGRPLPGLSPDNTATVASLGYPYITTTGKVGFVGSAAVGTAAPTSFVFFDASVIFRAADASGFAVTGTPEDTAGFGDQGQFVYSQNILSGTATLDSAIGRTTPGATPGKLLGEGDLAPGAPAATPPFSITFASRPRMAADGTAYFVSGYRQPTPSPPATRAFYRVTPGGAPELLLAGNQTVAGITLGGTTGVQFSYDVSENNAYRINRVTSTDLSNNNYLLITGPSGVSVFLREGDPLPSEQPGENWQSFVSNNSRGVNVMLGINNAGNTVVNAQTNLGFTYDYVIAYNNRVVNRVGDTIGGVSIDINANLRSLALNNKNNAAFVWGRGLPGDLAFREDLFYGYAPLLRSRAVRLLTTGDQLDVNNDGAPDYAVTDIRGDSLAGSGLDLSDAPVVYVPVVVTDLATNTPNLEAIIRLSVPAGYRCAADWNKDGAVNSADITAFLSGWFADRAASPQTTNADFNGSANTDSADITAFLSAWFAARTNGC